MIWVVTWTAIFTVWLFPNDCNDYGIDCGKPNYEMREKVMSKKFANRDEAVKFISRAKTYELYGGDEYVKDIRLDSCEVR